MRKICFLMLSIIFSANIKAQDSSKALVFSGYAELYYQYDFNKPAGSNRPAFVYSHNRHNEFNLNLGFAKASYNTDRVRANLSFAAGTYVNANYTSEPGVLKNIMEANAGIRLSKKKNIWLDAGILPSHIGFESAIGKDCKTLTRSLLADNSPYFEAGAKLTYTTDDSKWMLSAMALNGWQRITRVSGNSLMSWGTQLQYKPSDKVLLNYSTFLGTDKPDSARQMRCFHNLYGIFAVTNKLNLTVGFDIGTEEKLTGGHNTWYSPVVIAGYNFSDKWAIAARAEYYSDPASVMIGSPSVNGFKASGLSLNIDHSPYKNVLLRMEIKNLAGKEPVFLRDNKLVKNSTSLAFSFSCGF